MPGSKWHFVLTDMTGTKIGEFQNAYERKYRANLSAYSTASFQIRKDNVLLPYMFPQAKQFDPAKSLIAAEDYLLQVWQDSTLRMWGPIVTANYVMTEGQPPSIAVTAVDPAWRMTLRQYFNGTAGMAVGPAHKWELADDLVAYHNSLGMTGLRTFTADQPASSGGDGSYKAETGIDLYTHFQNIAQGFDGFDWYVEPLASPIFNTNPYLPYIGNLRYLTVVGSEKSNLVFEHGVGKRNMRQLNFLRDQTTRGNIIWNLSELGLEATAANPTPLVLAHDAANWERFGRYEAMAELNGVNNTAMREQYAKEMLTVRKNPRQVLSMTSDIDDETGRVPRFGTDYWLGDTIYANAVIEGASLFSGLVRVYAVEVALDNNGAATYTPILVQEGS